MLTNNHLPPDYLSTRQFTGADAEKALQSGLNLASLSVSVCWPYIPLYSCVKQGSVMAGVTALASMWLDSPRLILPCCSRLQYHCDEASAYMPSRSRPILGAWGLFIFPVRAVLILPCRPTCLAVADPPMRLVCTFWSSLISPSCTTCRARMSRTRSLSLSLSLSLSASPANSPTPRPCKC